ncbi:MAG: phosphatidylglycerophosphatase A [Candidatus Eisenbacteria bacterium]
MRTFGKWLAMLGPVGLVPGPRATYGSAVVAAIGWFLPVPPLWLFFVLLVVGTLIAIWAAGEAEHELGHDANAISIDEAVGQSITLLFVPHTIAAFVAAFFLFRLFDIWKPLGAREAQALPGGLGVVADDAIAGVISCVAFHALRYGLGLAGMHWLG